MFKLLLMCFKGWRRIVLVKYKVEVDLKTCISTGACYATDSMHYVSGKAQQANVVGGQTDESKSSNVFDDDRLADAQAGAESCPVSAIKITKL
jgi:ferredoxin